MSAPSSPSETRPVSPWLDDEQDAAAPPSWPAPTEKLSVDVVVVGGGMVGLSAAIEAQRDGASVALVEGRSIGSGVSGNTTAKLSALHGLRYASMASKHGDEVAADYAQANQRGLARVRELSEELGIDCDLREKPNATYTEDPSRLEEIRDEVEAASRAGLPVTFTESTDLPFSVVGVVTCAGQAEFHPVRYLRGLAAALEAGGGRVFERSRAVGVSGDSVRLESGAELRAAHVVVATQLPFLDRSLLFARASVQRSYAITVRIRGPVPQGMYLQAEKPGRSIRAIPWRGEELLMVGGESHELGHGEPAESFAALERYARERFDVESFEHRWDAHDFMPDDGLPFIGRLQPGSDRLLTVSGLSKWGLALGAESGRILADMAAGRENRFAERFDPWRLPKPSALLESAKLGADTAYHLVRDRLSFEDASGLAPGEGRVVRDGRKLKAVHRDDAGELHAVSARCTHLGCIVHWNGPESTWDCPCHGSRFGKDGGVLTGPATSPLSREEPPPD